jgi:cysteinyl-tRNA synthetase
MARWHAVVAGVLVALAMEVVIVLVSGRLSLIGGLAVNRHLAAEPYDYRGLKSAIETIEDLAGGVFGLRFESESGGDVDLASDLVELVLDVREQEREAGNYDRADDLRDELEALGVEVGDSADGPTYRLP